MLCVQVHGCNDSLSLVCLQAQGESLPKICWCCAAVALVSPSMRHDKMDAHWQRAIAVRGYGDYVPI